MYVCNLICPGVYIELNALGKYQASWMCLLSVHADSQAAHNMRSLTRITCNVCGCVCVHVCLL